MYLVYGPPRLAGAGLLAAPDVLLRAAELRKALGVPPRTIELLEGPGVRLRANEPRDQESLAFEFART